MMMRKMISKKAQFYIFTALMLIGYSTLLLQSFTSVPESSRNFRRAYENFEFESGQVLNNALFAQADVPDEYERFIESFISYSKMKKLNLELVAVLEQGDYVYFINRMESPVTILNLNWTVPSGTTDYFLRSNLSEAVLEVRDDVFHENIYKFSISGEGTGAKAVLRVGTGSKREIFVKE
ncbi:hypothetical protein KY363_01235 [Candidatus Woesearchaeota archaeon]|nr:hypothetical protein [Candidatus Woesearchaeota archaeon]